MKSMSDFSSSNHSVIDQPFLMLPLEDSEEAQKLGEETLRPAATNSQDAQGDEPPPSPVSSPSDAPSTKELSKAKARFADSFFVDQRDDLERCGKHTFAYMKQSSAHARRGQQAWRQQLAAIEEKWSKLAHDNLYARKQVLKSSKKRAGFRRQCVELMLQIAALNKTIAPELNDASDAWVGFRVLDPAQFRFFLIDGARSMNHKAFCNVWRRVGFLPENKKWHDAFEGRVKFVLHVNPK